MTILPFLKTIKQIFPTLSKKGVINAQGFTLIELLVVFSLVTFVTSLGIVAFAGYNRSQEVIQSTNSIKLLIQEAKFNALSAVKPLKTPAGVSTSCSTDPLSGYRLDFSSSNTEASLYILCGGNSDLYKKITLPTNIIFGVATTCSSVSFDAISATPSGLPCTIAIEGQGNEKTLSIDISGNVSIN